MPSRRSTIGLAAALLLVGSTAHAGDPFRSHAQAGPPPPPEDLPLTALSLTVPEVGGEWSPVPQEPDATKDVVALKNGEPITVTLENDLIKGGCLGGVMAIHVAIAKATGKERRVRTPAYLPASWFSVAVEGTENGKNVIHACVDRPGALSLLATVTTTASPRDPAIAPPIQRLLAAVARAAGAKSTPLPPGEGASSVRVDALDVTLTPGRAGVLWKATSRSTEGHTATVVSRSNPLDPMLEAEFIRMPSSCARFNQVFGAKFGAVPMPAYAPQGMWPTVYSETTAEHVRRDYFCAEESGGKVQLIETAYTDVLGSEDRADLRALLEAALATKGTDGSHGRTGGGGSSSSSGSDRPPADEASLDERQFGLSELNVGLGLVLRPEIAGGAASATAAGVTVDVRLSLIDLLLEQKHSFRIGDDLAVGVGLGLGLGDVGLWARIRAGVGLQAYYSFSSTVELGARAGILYDGDSVRDASSNGFYATGKLRIWRIAIEAGGGSNDYILGKIAALLSARESLSPTLGVRFERLAASDGPSTTNTFSLEVGAPF